MADLKSQNQVLANSIKSINGRAIADIKSYNGLLINNEGSWDVSTASYDNVYYSLSSEISFNNGIYFKPDGTKMFVSGQIYFGGSSSVFEFSLSTAWDVSTASFVNRKQLTSQDTSLGQIYFKSDGTKMFVIGANNSTVYQYSLSTAWDVSTASYDNKNKSISAQDVVMSFIFFKPDGTKMYSGSYNKDTVYQYSLSTAWDVSTASYDNKNCGVGSQETSPYCLFFKPDGTKMYIVGETSDTVYQYSLSTAWDVSTASYDNKNKSVNAQDTRPRGVFIKDDGYKMYISGYTNKSIFQYSLT